MKQPDPYYFEAIKMTSQAFSKFTENTRLRLVSSVQNLTRLVTSFLWLRNSIDQAVSQNNTAHQQPAMGYGDLSHTEVIISHEAI